MLNNNFLLFNKKRHIGSVAWDIEHESGDSFPGALYLARALVILDQSLGPLGLTFVGTPSINSMPLTGDSVIVILHEDEWCRIPSYANDVLAVFKTYGTNLQWAANPFLQFSSQAILSSLQDARTEISRTPTRWRSRKRANIFELPLGYFRQLDLEPKDIMERRFDIYFGGSVKSQRAMRKGPLAVLDRGIETPKNRSRRLMLESVAIFADRHPEFIVEFDVTKSFWDIGISEAERYSRTMLETKICLVPRGSNLETYRFFEALRYGCAVVAEQLPSRWFYDEAPIDRVRSWDDLEGTALRLLSDPDALKKRQHESLAWWREVCSELAVASFIESQVRSVMNLSRNLQLDLV